MRISFVRESIRQRAVLSLCVLAPLAACGGESPVTTPRSVEPPSSIVPPETPSAPASGLAALPLLTYDGSGQAVHPDVAVNEAHAALVLTPYPFGNADFENPAVYLPAGNEWTVPRGMANPLVKANEGYLSDPDMLFDNDSRQWWLYYRQYTKENVISLIRSADRRSWSAPVEVARGNGQSIVSPSIVRRGTGDWLMYSVNAFDGCTSSLTLVEQRRSTDGIRWSAPRRVGIDAIDGLLPWHLEVQWIPSRHEYWMLFSGKPLTSCNAPAMYLATSADGVTWTTHPNPILEHGELFALEDIVYRSSFLYDEKRDVVLLWHSGARAETDGFHWSIAAEERTRDALFARARNQSGPMAVRMAPRAAPLLLVAP